MLFTENAIFTYICNFYFTLLIFQPVLPSVFSAEDCHRVITEVTKSMCKQGSVLHVYSDTIIVSGDLLQRCQESFSTLMMKTAQEVSNLLFCYFKKMFTFILILLFS